MLAKVSWWEHVQPRVIHPGFGVAMVQQDFLPYLRNAVLRGQMNTQQEDLLLLRSYVSTVGTGLATDCQSDCCCHSSGE